MSGLRDCAPRKSVCGALSADAATAGAGTGGPF